MSLKTLCMYKLSTENLESCYSEPFFTAATIIFDFLQSNISIKTLNSLDVNGILQKPHENIKKEDCFSFYLAVKKHIQEVWGKYFPRGQELLKTVDVSTSYFVHIDSPHIHRYVQSLNQEEFQKCLFQAVRVGQIDLFNALFSHEVFFDFKSLVECFKNTCTYGHVEILRLLISHPKFSEITSEDFVKEFKSSCGMTDYYYLSGMSGKKEVYPDIVQTLMNHSKSNMITTKNLNEVFEEICRIGNDELVRFFMHHPRFNEIKTYFLNEGFVSVCSSGSCELVRFFIDHPRFNEIRQSRTKQSFYNACTSGHVEIVAIFLCSSFFVNIPFNFFIRCFQFSCAIGRFEVVDFLLKNFKFDGLSLGYGFRWACKEGRYEVVERFINDSSFENIAFSDFNKGFLWVCQFGKIYQEDALDEDSSPYADEFLSTYGDSNEVSLSHAASLLHSLPSYSSFVQNTVEKMHRDFARSKEDSFADEERWFNYEENNDTQELNWVNIHDCDYIKTLQALVGCPQFNDISLEDFILSFHNACKGQHFEIVQFLIMHPQFMKIPVQELEKSFCDACQKESIEIVQMLAEHLRFEEISNKSLGFGFKAACEQRYPEIVQFLITLSRFDQIPIEDLEQGFFEACKINNSEVVECLIQLPNFNTFNFQNLKAIFHSMCENCGYDHEEWLDMIIIVMNHPNFAHVFNHFSFEVFQGVFKATNHYVDFGWCEKELQLLETLFHHPDFSIKNREEYFNYMRNKSHYLTQEIYELIQESTVLD